MSENNKVSNNKHLSKDNELYPLYYMRIEKIGVVPMEISNAIIQENQFVNDIKKCTGKIF